MSHWLQDQIARGAPMKCAKCGWSACRCYELERAETERTRLGIEERSIREAIASAHPTFPVLLQRSGEWVKGLEIEGVATTRLWDEGDHYPLAAGLKRLDGSTIGYGVGRVMRKMERTLPVPVFWRHEKNKALGYMFEARATVDKLYFTACIVPPGTTGYDRTLLERVWEDVRTGTANAVSFTAHTKSNGAWKPIELSVCPDGANPCATITRASFPNGETIYREEVPFDEERIRTANAKHHQSRDAQMRSASTSTPEQRSSPGDLREMVKAEVAEWCRSMHRGVWREGETYEKGQMCTRQGATWSCQADGVNGKPGESADWVLIVKAGRDGR